MQFNSGSGALGVLAAVASSAFAIAVTITWLVIGWRAMRAHEQIADALRERLDT